MTLAVAILILAALFVIGNVIANVVFGVGLSRADIGRIFGDPQP